MWARTVRGDAFGLDLEADEALVCDGELQLRRLDDDRGVGARVFEHGGRSDRCELLVGDCGDDRVAAQAFASRGGVHDRGQSALHVVRATAVHPPALDARLERGVHSRNADGIEVRVEHERAAAAGARFDGDHARTVVRADELGLEAGVPAPLGHEARELGLAARAGDQLGIDRVDRDELRDQLGQRVVRQRTGCAPRVSRRSWRCPRRPLRPGRRAASG